MNKEALSLGMCVYVCVRARACVCWYSTYRASGPLHSSTSQMGGTKQQKFINRNDPSLFQSLAVDVIPPGPGPYRAPMRQRKLTGSSLGFQKKWVCLLLFISSGISVIWVCLCHPRDTISLPLQCSLTAFFI